MLVITILACALALWALGWALCAFKRYTLNRFKRRFLPSTRFSVRCSP
jgi:hypothetical protein